MARHPSRTTHHAQPSARPDRSVPRSRAPCKSEQSTKGLNPDALATVFSWGQGKPRFHLALALQAKPALGQAAPDTQFAPRSALRFSHVFGVRT
ncbi:protein of unknown function [Thiomonas sp. Bio17B3]|nr:protein of unknown function [Thiomonas sp. Bio17B3]